MEFQNSYVAAEFVGMFRDQPFELAERRQWYSQFTVKSPHQLLVATNGEGLFGYTASFQYRGGGVFSRTVETSVYTSKDHQSNGTGTLLYKTLFERLSAFELHLAVVGIALANEPSIKLHRKFGFEEVGTFTEYAFFQRHLRKLTLDAEASSLKLTPRIFNHDSFSNRLYLLEI